ncbi:hypothetical protein CR163_000395 [Prosthecochloris sp. ZM_2]|nr:hypothetical protein CR163_000395 [Prosthecochloris sp. ZM_2]
MHKRGLDAQHENTYFLLIYHNNSSLMKHLISIIVTCTLLLCSRTAAGSLVPVSSDARIRSMGGVTASLIGYAPAMYTNPATLAGSESMTASLAYSDPLGKSAMTTVQGILAVPRMPFDDQATAALAYDRFGDDLYRETTVLLGYATRVTQWLAAGVSFGWMQREFSAADDDSAPGISAGLVASVSERLSIGAGMTAINTPEIGDNGETVPHVLTTGATVRLDDDMLLGGDIRKQQGRKASWCFGGEAGVLPWLMLRAGVSGNPWTYSGGTGLQLGDVHLDAAMIRYPDLEKTGFAVSVQMVIR